MKKIFWFHLFTFSIFTVAAQPQTPSFVTDSLDAYINQGLKAWTYRALPLPL
jgi:hypothetical protein